MKTKGQQPRGANLELLAVFSFCGELAEWSNATDCKSAKALTSFRGFESRTHRQTLTSPAHSANCEQGLSLGLAPKAGLSRSTVIVRPLPKKRKGFNDMPQLPDQLPEIRQT